MCDGELSEAADNGALTLSGGSCQGDGALTMDPHNERLGSIDAGEEEKWFFNSSSRKGRTMPATGERDYARICPAAHSLSNIRRCK